MGASKESGMAIRSAEDPEIKIKYTETSTVDETTRNTFLFTKATEPLYYSNYITHIVKGTIKSTAVRLLGTTFEIL